MALAASPHKCGVRAASGRLHGLLPARGPPTACARLALIGHEHVSTPYIRRGAQPPAMLTTDWKTLAAQACDTYETSLARTLELFPLDDEALAVLNKLPSARGAHVQDFGAPAPVPVDVYRASVPRDVLRVTEQDPHALLQQIRAGTLSCVEVLSAYFHAAVFAARLVNCVCEFLPEEALAQARSLDADPLLRLLPLCGMPLLLKEMIPFPNRAVTNGSLCHLDRVTPEAADIVRLLAAAGAVPFVRTTNPQLLMMLECESNAHGRTVNPRNASLTCGGSSGGEGALNGLGALALGLGSDIGGSIRCPSSFNGLYGLRTTVGRIPSNDFYLCQRGSESILSVTGPMTRSLALAELAMKTLVDAKPWLVDPLLVPLPWTPPKRTRFKVAFLPFDGVVMPQPPVQRALRLVRDKLAADPNVEVLDFAPYRHDEAWEIISSLYFEDGGKDTREALEATGEPMLEQTSWAFANPHVKPLSIAEVWLWNLRKQDYRKRYLAHWLAQGAPDAVIAPVFPGPPAKHRTTKYWGYTAQWNLLDYPALAFPVTTVDPELDKADTAYKPINDIDRYIHTLYDGPESFANAQVGLCAVGLRYTEETLFDIVKTIAK